MFALFVTIKIKPGRRDEFIEATMGDAIGSNNDEPGCLRFDVHASDEDPNTGSTLLLSHESRSQSDPGGSASGGHLPARLQDHFSA